MLLVQVACHLPVDDHILVRGSDDEGITPVAIVYTSNGIPAPAYIDVERLLI